MLFKSLFLILSHGFSPACPPEKVLVIDTGLARLNFAHLAHPLLLTRALGQRVLLDTQLLQHLAVVPHTVLALLFNLLLALNQQDQLGFICQCTAPKNRPLRAKSIEAVKKPQFGPSGHRPS